MQLSMVSSHHCKMWIPCIVSKCIILVRSEVSYGVVHYESALNPVGVEDPICIKVNNPYGHIEESRMVQYYQGSLNYSMYMLHECVSSRFWRNWLVEFWIPRL